MSESPGASGPVFVSYAREDSGHVDRLQRVLQHAGIPVWRDTTQLWPGQDWRAQIRGAITGDALVFLVCFSQASLSRTMSYQNEELVLAIEQLRLRPADDSWLIPVRFDDCQIPDRDIGAGRTLGSIHRADLFGEGYDRNASRLVEAILRRLGHVDGRAGQFVLVNRPVTASADLEENTDVSAIVNPWVRTPPDEPYVLAEDSAAVHQWNASLVPGDPRVFELHVLPEPALGLHDAPVVLLMANPGSTPGDRLIDRTWLTAANRQALLTPGRHAELQPR